MGFEHQSQLPHETSDYDPRLALTAICHPRKGRLYHLTLFNSGFTYKLTFEFRPEKKKTQKIDKLTVRFIFLTNFGK